MSSRRKVIEDISHKLNRPAIHVLKKPPSPEDISDPLLTEREVCALTGLDRTTLYRLRNSRKIGFYKFGKVIRYGREHIREFLQEHEREPKN